MTQYKTIAGPVGLEVQFGQDYEDTVKKYAAIIEAEAVGGWELTWIQQIPVVKKIINISGVIALAVLGAVIGFYMGLDPYRGLNPVTILVSAVLFTVIGCVACKNRVIEWFNMLIFSKKD
jgi:hypothetical protein